MKGQLILVLAVSVTSCRWSQATADPNLHRTKRAICRPSSIGACVNIVSFNIADFFKHMYSDVGATLENICSLTDGQTDEARQCLQEAKSACRSGQKMFEASVVQNLITDVDFCAHTQDCSQRERLFTGIRQCLTNSIMNGITRGICWMHQAQIDCLATNMKLCPGAYAIYRPILQQVASADNSCKVNVPELTIEGSWTAWGTWGQCSVTCGEGQMSRSRSCDRNDCTGSRSERKSCNAGACVDLPTDGWYAWTSWSRCTTSCGHGVQRRSRGCRDRNCAGHDHELKLCLMEPCQGYWREWQDWGGCSFSCGGGQRARYRWCLSMGDSQQVEACNAHRCANNGTLP